ncbi:MAG: metallophosphoesterase [Alphaproteobacteria bacterium]
MNSLLLRLSTKKSFWHAVDAGMGILQKIRIYNPEPPPLQVTSYKLPSANWLAHYSPLKIAIASDFHVGCPLVDLEYLEKVVERINKIGADIILMPGDFLNSPYGYNGAYVEPEKIAHVLSSLKAPGGVFGTLGNHDWYEDPQGMWNSLGAAGIKMLENQSVKIEWNGMQFWIAGVDDYGTGHSDLTATFSNVTDDLPIIAMCHNPFSIYDMPQNPVITFAGHTHGGQYKIPLISKIPFLKLPIQDCPDKDMTYGMMERQGRHLCVNSGIGTSLYSARNVAPEIVEFTLLPG